MKVMRRMILYILVLSLMMLFPVRAEAYEVYGDPQSASVILRDALKNMEDETSIHYDFSGMDNDEVNEITKEIYISALKHVKDRDAGEAVRITLTEISWSYEVNGSLSDVTVYFSFTYNMEKEKDYKLREAMDQVIAMLNLEGKSDYEKARDIYVWIASHVTYDSSGTYNDAYSAMFERTSMCSGIAMLYYRMAITAGLDSRYVYGTAGKNGTEVNHAWNLIQIDGEWYSVDLTWDESCDSNIKKYKWFLKSDEDFKDHIASEDQSDLPACNETYTYDQTVYDIWMGNTVNGSHMKAYPGEIICLMPDQGNAYTEVKRFSIQTVTGKEVFYETEEDGSIRFIMPDESLILSAVKSLHYKLYHAPKVSYRIQTAYLMFYPETCTFRYVQEEEKTRLEYLGWKYLGKESWTEIESEDSESWNPFAAWR